MREILLLAIALITGQVSGEAFAQQSPSAEIAPYGTLRVAMISGNPILMTKKSGGAIGGVSVDLGKRIAEKLHVPYKAVVYEDEEAYFASFRKGEWDIAIGPRRLTEEPVADFTPDIMLVDNLLLAAPGHRYSSLRQVDRSGVRIAVAKGSATEQFLRTMLKSAELVPVDAGRDRAVEALNGGKAHLYGGPVHTVYGVLEELPKATIVPGQFNTVRIAVALPKGRSTTAQTRLAYIVKEANNAGVVQKALGEAGIRGVRPGPS